MNARVPELVAELRPPVAFSVEWSASPGAAQVTSLWRRTSGQAPSILGALGGLCLLGPSDSEAERAKWLGMMTGAGPDAVAHPDWDVSTSREPTRVPGVYYAAGWIPVLGEPMEANYLAVDLAPLDDGRPGQIILCGRDEDEKCVVASDLATLLESLAADCADAAWEIRTGRSKRGDFRYVAHRDGRLLSVLRRRSQRR